MQKSDQDADSVPMPVVLIDQDSDSGATIVQISFGDRLGALVDTVNRLLRLNTLVLNNKLFLLKNKISKIIFFYTDVQETGGEH